MSAAQDLLGERWLPVPEQFGYEASPLGRIRSVDRVQVRKDGKSYRLRGKVLTQVVMPAGHLQVTLERGSRFLSHHVILITFVGPRPDGLMCCHWDGDPANNRLENLRWDTPRANELDKIRHGNHTMANRTRCPRSHPLVKPNLTAWELDLHGYRSCLACHRATSYIRDRAAKGEVLDMQVVSDRYYSELMAVAS
jgi:hypothetical protein